MARRALPTGIAVTLAYVAISVVFLWPVVTPGTIMTHVQDVDSALISTVMGHSSLALSGGLPSLWDFEIFHPIKDTLCLTEPMLFPSVLCIPLIRAMGSGPAHNLWIYFAWVATALGGYAYLRHRGLDRISSFLGGFCAAFSPDRLSHAVGHSHLFFQAGFPLVLLATEKVFLRRNDEAGTSRIWPLMFGGIVLVQVFSGFYITVIFMLWCLFMIPASAWSAAGGRIPDIMSAFKRHGLLLVAVTALTALLMAPVLRHYREFGAGFFQNPLERSVMHSATWRGSLLPPHDLQQCLTVPGFLMLNALGKPGDLEDIGYPGLTTMVLVVCGAVLFFRRSDRSIMASCCASPIYWLALASVALVAFILSLGPYLDPGSRSPTKLPYAYLYAWCEPLRFIRAPGRFTFIVQWAAAIAAAHGLALVRQRLDSLGHQRAAMWVAVGFTTVMSIEFLPLHTAVRMDCRRDGFTEYLMTEKERLPFVQLPAGDPGYMTQLGIHFRPMVNGFSGYCPAYRAQELAFFDHAFPSDEAYMLMQRWGVRRVFVGREAPGGQIDAAAGDRRLRRLWSGKEGILYEATGTFPDFQDYLQRRRANSCKETTTPVSMTLLSGFTSVDPAWDMQTSMSLSPRRSNESFQEWTTDSAKPSISFTATKRALDSAVFTHVRMRVRISNWYNLQERGAVYWMAGDAVRFDEDRCVEFTIPADGEFHEIVVDVGELITWVADSAISQLRFSLGRRSGNRVAIESLRLEQGPVRWEQRKNW